MSEATALAILGFTEAHQAVLGVLASLLAFAALMYGLIKVKQLIEWARR